MGTGGGLTVGLTLFAAISLSGSLALVWTVLKVLIGLGLVIFVHELGHFLVAKACGVKCEKFYIGFDVPIKIGPIALPRTLGKVQWGETEYGIGIIPLGGYVKMLGQDDNPANAQREAERSRVKPEAEEPTADAADADTPDSDTEFAWDPRSFPAKSVPQRMAIISAGVIMNLIFAVIFAAIAYRAGANHEPCEVGGITPGSPAWVNNLPIGSKIIQIGKTGVESEYLRFDWDLRQKVALGGMSDDRQPVDFLLRTPSGEQEWIELMPSNRLQQLGISDFVTVGVRSTYSTTLAPDTPALPYMAAAGSEPALKGGDRIIGVNGQLFATDRANGSGDLPADELEAALSQHRSTPLKLTVQRKMDGESESGPQTRTLEVTLPPQPRRVVGVQVGVDHIVAVRNGSPAAEAGLQAGDEILRVNGQPANDAMQLPDQLRALAGQEVTMDVRRFDQGQDQELSVTLVPEPRDRFLPNFGPGSLVPIEAIGVAYAVSNELTGVAPDSSAQQAGLRAGDRIISAQFVAPDEESESAKWAREFFGSSYNDPVEFTDKLRNWPQIASSLQVLPPGIQLKLTVDRGGQEIIAELLPQDAEQQFAYDRGLQLTPLQRIHTASTWAEATRLGVRETKEKLFQVLDFLGKLVTLQLSPKNIGGPIMIAAAAGSEASQGIARLLLFLTFLSANLAILNFLPIPALDGGHMLFLTVEAVIGKPVDERLQGTLTMIGVAALLGLMIFVFANDISRFLL
jgi:regulator of sigma E protease